MSQNADYQPKPEIIEHPARVGTGFDLRTHIKNAKTGETIKEQPYRRFCVGLKVYYERPKFSGNLVFEDGKHAGRRFQDKEGKWVIDESLPHEAYVAKRTELVRPEDIADENEALRAELAARDAELAMLKGEKQDKVEQVAQNKPQAQAAPQRK